MGLLGKKNKGNRVKKVSVPKKSRGSVTVRILMEDGEHEVRLTGLRGKRGKIKIVI